MEQKVVTYLWFDGDALYVECEDQAELTTSGRSCRPSPNRSSAAGSRTAFGLSWQIIPKGMVDAMLKMKKIVIADLEEARRTSPLADSNRRPLLTAFGVRLSPTECCTRVCATFG
jgi:hypothetical protein